jgi:hypothetical protein
MPIFTSNQILSKVEKYGDRLIGHSARKLKSMTDGVHLAKEMRVKGIEQRALTKTDRLANVARGRSTQTRVKTGLGVATATTAGFLGLHKYHQHKDNKILARIDKQYEKK